VGFVNLLVLLMNNPWKINISEFCLNLRGFFCGFAWVLRANAENIKIKLLLNFCYC